MYVYAHAYVYVCIHIHTHVSVIDFFANGLTTTLQQQCLYVFVVLTTSLQLQEDCKIA